MSSRPSSFCPLRIDVSVVSVGVGWVDMESSSSRDLLFRDKRASTPWHDWLAQCRNPVRYGRRSGARFTAFSRPERKLRQMDSIFCTWLDLGTTASRSEGYAVACLRFFTTTGEEPGSVHHPRCARAQNST